MVQTRIASDFNTSLHKTEKDFYFYME